MKNIYIIKYYTCFTEMNYSSESEPRTFTYHPNGFYSTPRFEMEYYNKDNELSVTIEADGIVEALIEWNKRYPSSFIMVSIKDIRVETDIPIAVA